MMVLNFFKFRNANVQESCQQMFKTEYFPNNLVKLRSRPGPTVVCDIRNLWAPGALTWVQIPALRDLGEVA